jgi:hypothetical protein
VLILTTGCFGGGEEEAPAPAAEQAQASEPTATPVPPTPEAQPAAETPTTEAAAGTSTETNTAQEASAPAGSALAVEDSPEINSYRMHVIISTEGESGVDQVEIQGAYVKEPRAEQITMSYMQGEESEQIEIITVDGVNYMRAGDMWIQSPDANLNIAELTLLTPQSVASLLGEMEVIGAETVNDRPSTHYRGGKEMIPVVGTESDTMDMSQAETAQLDIWVDDALQVINRLTLEGSDTSVQPPVAFKLTYDYLDFNTEIAITAPETMAEAAPAGDAPAAGDFVPNNELGQLLGFNLMFPVDSTVETVVGANLYVVVAPFTLDEAQTFVESQMQSNGYTQLAKNVAPSGEVVYLYQRDQKAVSVTLSDAGDGKTRFQFATGP